MPVVLHRQEDGYQIAVWQMQEALAELKQHPYALPFVQEASLFKSEQRQREWLSTRILLHNLLGRKVQIRYSSQG
ncbi:MAG: siderophore biosynthesis protein, partial [Bacteroides sp.]